MATIKIEYDGKYPNLCSGNLVVYINDTKWEFPDYCLSSKGNVWFDDEYNEHIEYGEWIITEFPKNFPEELKNEVEDIVNAEISHGCCGGCS